LKNDVCLTIKDTHAIVTIEGIYGLSVKIPLRSIVGNSDAFLTKLKEAYTEIQRADKEREARNTDRRRKELSKYRAERRQELTDKLAAKAVRDAKNPADWTPKERKAAAFEARTAAYWTPERRAMQRERTKAQSKAAEAYHKVMLASSYEDTEGAVRAKKAAFDAHMSAAGY
jgi:hypothetical protein